MSTGLEDGRGALERALDLLEVLQKKTGQFAVFTGDDLDREGGIEDDSCFATAHIAQSLLTVQHPRARALASRACDYLGTKVEPGGVVRYWSGDHPLGGRIPPDVDDTSNVLCALEQVGNAPADARRLLLANRRSDGAFYTWLSPRLREASCSMAYWRVAAKEWRTPARSHHFWNQNAAARYDTDAVVSANAVHYIGNIPEVRSTVDFLRSVFSDEREGSADKWYRDPIDFYYAVSRCFAAGISGFDDLVEDMAARLVRLQTKDGAIGNSQLSTALAARALQNLEQQHTAVEQACRYLVGSQGATGAWSATPFYFAGPQESFGFGSAELTTAFAIEALAGWIGESLSDPRPLPWASLRSSGLLTVNAAGVYVSPTGADTPELVHPRLALAWLHSSDETESTSRGCRIEGDQIVQAPLPLSVFVEDGRARAWPAGRSEWVPLDKEEVTVLATLTEARSCSDIARAASDLGLADAHVQPAIARLVTNGVVELSAPEVAGPSANRSSSPGTLARDAVDYARRGLGVARRSGLRGVANVLRNAIADRVRATPPPPMTPMSTQGDDGSPALAPSGRTPVFAVDSGSDTAPFNLALGLIVATARAVDHGALNIRYDIRPIDLGGSVTRETLSPWTGAAVVLASDYMWSSEANLELSRELKLKNPRVITIHGGPQAPKYEAEAEAFLRDHPYVDVLVRGEGELTTSDILRALPDNPGPGDLDCLAAVPGVTFRRLTPDGYEVVRTPDRPRADDLNEFPSPYLSGEFDHIDVTMAIIETNRGCPYGCTFCDWGSATMSRVRRYDLERVKAELDWVVDRKVECIFFADANFGMTERDVEVAAHLADLRRRHGAPASAFCAFAKNTTRYTAEIVRLWAEAGICSEGTLALQTNDQQTLVNVDRKNIKVEKYNDLAEAFSVNNLPIVSDIMIGLPGATVQTFKDDLQLCINQEVTARLIETMVLPNSPMNDPAYRERYELVLANGSDVLVSTSSYSEVEYAEMLRLRVLFRAGEHFGLLRHVLRYLRREHGRLEVEVLHDIDRSVQTDPDAYPLLAFVARCFDLLMVPPVSWEAYYAEVARWIGARYGIVEDGGMRTVMAVQGAIMPTPGRSYPHEVELAHDYVAYDRDHRIGAGQICRSRPIVEYGPARLTVDDPNHVSTERLGAIVPGGGRHRSHDNFFIIGGDWELNSELTRAMLSTVAFTTA
jgi:radical SAM superfamily enzyme YgiQ (UPF0313 family)